MGYYPLSQSDSLLSRLAQSYGTPGIERPDSQYQPSHSVTFPITPEQATAAQHIVDNRVANPGSFSVFAQDCVTTVEQALAAAGIRVNPGPSQYIGKSVPTIPKDLFSFLRQHYTTNGDADF